MSMWLAERQTPLRVSRMKPLSRLFHTDLRMPSLVQRLCLKNEALEQALPCPAGVLPPDGKDASQE